MKKHLQIFLPFTILLILLLLLPIVMKKKLPRVPNALCPRCNVILVDIDILRADALPCYGGKQDTMPHLCSRTKKSGVLFNNNYSQSYWTLPNFFSTITSIYPTYHQVFTEFDALASNIPTLASILQTHGYTTSYIGNTNNTTLTHKNGGLQGYKIYTDIWDIWETATKSSHLQLTAPFFSHLYTSELHMPIFPTAQERTSLPSSPPKNIPLTHEQFLPILGAYVHKHYQTIFTQQTLIEYPQYFNNSKNITNSQMGAFFYELAQKQATALYFKDIFSHLLAAYIESATSNNKINVDFLRTLYEMRLKSIDNNLDLLFTSLSATGLDKNTVVIIYSDHGEAFGEHDQYGHFANLYSEVLHTPFIMFIPGFPSSVIDTTVQNIDIMPTILDIVGIPPLSTIMQGKSVVPILANTEETIRYAIAQQSPNIIAIQDQQYLLIINTQNTPTHYLLFDKRIDPLELTDISSKFPDVIKRFETYITTNYPALLDRSYTIPFPSIIDEEKRKRLIKEGYF